MIRSIAVAAIATAVAAWSSPRIGTLPPLAAESTVRLPASVLQTASGGFEALLADWYWLLAIQYYGTRSNVEEDYALLPDYLEAATDLDPDFDYVYQFGGQVLPELDVHDHLWHNTAASIRLLEKGMKSKSRRWQIPFLLAYDLYTFRGDYLAAGEMMQKAVARPRAPNYLNSFVGTLLGKGGSVDTAIAFTEAALQHAPDHWTKDDLEERLRSLTLQKGLDVLNEALRQRRAEGKTVERLSDLVGSGGLAAIPEEPFGGEFRLAEGRVVSTDDNKLVQVYRSPGAPPTERYAN